MVTASNGEQLDVNLVLDICQNTMMKINNRWFKTFTKQRNIYYFTTQNTPKASVTEGVFLTLRRMMYIFMSHKKFYKYTDDLEHIL